MDVTHFVRPGRADQFPDGVRLDLLDGMQRYTAHATSDGSLRESKYYCDQIMRTAEDLRFAMPELEALGSYLRRNCPTDQQMRC